MSDLLDEVGRETGADSSIDVGESRAATTIRDWLGASDRDQKRMRLWLDDVLAWGETKDQLLDDMKGDVDSLRTFLGDWKAKNVVRSLVCCQEACDEDGTSDADPVEPSDDPAIDPPTSQEKIEDRRRKAGQLADRTRPLPKRARKLAAAIRRRDRRLRSAVSRLPAVESRADDLGRMADRMKRIGRLSKGVRRGVRREAKALKKQAAKLSLEARSQFHEVDKKRKEAAIQGLGNMRRNLGELREGIEAGLAGAFNSFSTVVLVKYWTLSWLPGPIWLRLILFSVLIGALPVALTYGSRLGWVFWTVGFTALGTWLATLTGKLTRGPDSTGNTGPSALREVFLCGSAFAVVFLHGFVLRVNASALNGPALAGVHEDLWLLLHAAVGVMVFLAVALRQEGHSVCGRARQSLCKLRGLRRVDGEPDSPIDVTAEKRLETHVQFAVCAYVLLLGLVAIISYGAEPDVIGVNSSFDALRPDEMSWEWELWPLLASILFVFFLPVTQVWAHLPTTNEEEKGT